MTEYQGHKNYNHWSVCLHIMNEYNLYKLADYLVRTCKTRDQAARELLSYLPEKTSDGAPYTFSSVRAALTHWFK